MIEKIVELLGSKENITSAMNCMTRLRVTVKDEKKVMEDELKKTDTVLSLVHDRPFCYEVVVGPGKSRKYADACHDMGIPATQGADVKGLRSDSKKRNPVQKFLKTFGDIFVPLIPGIIAAGLCSGLAMLIVQLVPDYKSNTVWNIIHEILALINAAFVTYISAWGGYRAAEKFGATPILGGMLGMITSLDGINVISKTLGLYNAEVPLESILCAGRGGVIAAIAGAWFLSVVEKKIRKHMPDSLDIVFTPLCTLIICVVPYIFVLMPLLGYVSSGICAVIGKVCLSQSAIARMIAGFVSAALFLPMVATGTHHGLVALYTAQLQQFGFVTLYPALAMSGAAQVGAAIVVWIKARKAKSRRLVSIIEGALPAGILGVGEPLLYGMSIPLGKPLISASIAAGFGGAFVMLFQVASTTWGPSGLLGIFVMTAGPNPPIKTICLYLIGLAISVVMGIIISSIMIKQSDIPSESDDSVSDTEPLKEIPPAADGELVPMESIPDEVFSTGVLGKCIGVIPTSDKVFSPCDGTVTMIADTLHAVGIQSDDGADILVHVGINTVTLGGKGFDLKVKVGDRVKKGQDIMLADFELIKASGLDTTVITVLS